jgi:RNA polymerase sigma-70 factor (ECF subfamily)
VIQSSNETLAVVTDFEPEPRADALDSDRLVRESQDGSAEAFSGLVAQFHERIYNFLLKLTRQPHDAEDLTQDTFLKAWQAIRRFDHRYSFSTWLFTIAKRTAYNHLRSRRPVADPAEAPEGTDGTDPSSSLAQDEESRELWRLARSLKPKQYEMIWLRYGEGFSVAEAAKIMGLHEIHAKVLLHRGRKQLGRMLQRTANLI